MEETLPVQSLHRNYYILNANDNFNLIIQILIKYSNYKRDFITLNKSESTKVYISLTFLMQKNQDKNSTEIFFNEGN